MKQGSKQRRQVVSKLHVHLVFFTKHKKLMFTDKVLADFESIFAKVCESLESELIELNGGNDYVHLLVSYPSKLAVSTLVNSLKGVSSRLIRKKNHPDMIEQLGGDALWSPSYFASSDDGTLIKRYIKQQSKQLNCG